MANALRRAKKRWRYGPNKFILRFTVSGSLANSTLLQTEPNYIDVKLHDTSLTVAGYEMQRKMR